MSNPTLKRATGNWVVGDQFWDREVELSLFMERLHEGAHLLLTAPRRIGKTSLLKEVARRLAGNCLCLYIDLQKAESAADAVVELSLASHEYKPAWNRILSMFQNALRETVETVKIRDLSVVLRGGLTADNWRSKGDELLEILAEQDQPVALFLDEVAILVNRLLRGSDYIITDQRRQEVDAFLSWLRAASIRHQGRIRLVVTGSIGLEPLVRQAGLSATLNTFTPFHLGPWTRDVASGCLKALSRPTVMHYCYTLTQSRKCWSAWECTSRTTCRCSSTMSTRRRALRRRRKPRLPWCEKSISVRCWAFAGTWS